MLVFLDEICYCGQWWKYVHSYSECNGVNDTQYIVKVHQPDREILGSTLPL